MESDFHHFDDDDRHLYSEALPSNFLLHRRLMAYSIKASMLYYAFFEFMIVTVFGVSTALPPSLVPFATAILQNSTVVNNTSQKFSPLYRYQQDYAPYIIIQNRTHLHKNNTDSSLTSWPPLPFKREIFFHHGQTFLIVTSIRVPAHPPDRIRFFDDIRFLARSIAFNRRPSDRLPVYKEFRSSMVAVQFVAVQEHRILYSTAWGIVNTIRDLQSEYDIAEIQADVDADDVSVAHVRFFFRE